MTNENISLVISCFSAFVALAALVIAFFQEKRGWYINSVSNQRFMWAENLRETLSQFIDAYYQKKDLHSAKDLVFLYLNPGNAHHQSLVKEINRVVDSDVNDLTGVITAAQAILRWNWRMVKSETGISKNFEESRDRKAEGR